MHVSKEGVRHFLNWSNSPEHVFENPNEWGTANRSTLRSLKSSCSLTLGSCGCLLPSVYWQLWTCKGSQRAGTSLGSYWSILMKIFLQNLCQLRAVTFRTFFFSTLREYARMARNDRAPSSTTRRWVSSTSRASTPSWVWPHQLAPCLSAAVCRGLRTDRQREWTNGQNSWESVCHCYDGLNVSAAPGQGKADQVPQGRVR